MKRIGIITFHNADNLGAVLQAYALQTVLEESGGISAEIIDYRCDAIEETKYEKCGLGPIDQVKALPKKMYYAIKRRGFEKFRRLYLKCSENAYYPQSIHTDCPNYDAYITGSDQVWNLGCSGGDDAFFLDFVPKEKKKYAYAASMGKFRFPAEQYHHFFELLNQFDDISVREGSAVAELEQLGMHNVRICPDPVFLLSQKKWMEIMPRRLCKQRYVLVYLILPDRGITCRAEEYARQHKCRVIHNKKSIEFILHNSPEEFLSWVFHAECVFTNSFHGTALSLIFNKLLVADVEIAGGGINNRVQELLDAADAWKCAMRKDSSEAYAADAQHALEKMRQEGMAYLHKICEEI